MMRLTLTLCLVAGTLMAQGPGGPGPRRAWAGQPGRQAMAANADALKDALGLSDAQVQQLRDLRKQEFEAARPAMQQARDKRQALAEAMKSDNPDPAKIGQMMLEMKQLRQSMGSQRSDLQAKARAILTPDQQTKLQSLQDVQARVPALRQAMALGLIAPPAGAGPGGAGATFRYRGPARPRTQQQ